MTNISFEPRWHKESYERSEKKISVIPNNTGPKKKDMVDVFWSLKISQIDDFRPLLSYLDFLQLGGFINARIHWVSL